MPPLHRSVPHWHCLGTATNRNNLYPAASRVLGQGAVQPGHWPLPLFRGVHWRRLPALRVPQCLLWAWTLPVNETSRY